MASTLQFETDGKQAVFSDIFDTVILRNVHPENTKRLAARRLALVLGLDVSPEALYQLRANLEREACTANEQAGGDLDFCFDERFTRRLYDEMLASGWLSRMLQPEDFHQACWDAEVEAELHVQSLDDRIVRMLWDAKRAGLSVYAVSDFYLPAALLQRLFNGHGLVGLFDKIFVSGELSRTKRTGRLYDLVLESLQLSADRVLMIGDNEHSDVRMAEQKGLASYHVERETQRAFYDRALGKLTEQAAVGQALRRLLRDSCAQHSSERSFFPELALTLYSFIEKLHRRLHQAGVKDVFFLSREGEFLKRLFDVYQDAHHFASATRLRSHYLLVSRKSTFIASLSPLAEERFETLFRQYRRLSLRDFLSNLNMTEEDVALLSRELGCDPDALEDDFPTSVTYQALLTSPAFQGTYERYRTEQRSLFQRYVASFGVDIERSGMALVDVGWKGTIQDHLHRIYGGAVRVNGYYLGLIAPGAASETNLKEGLLFTTVGAHSPFFAVYNDNRPLFEIMLGASHGSADRYVPDGGDVRVATLELEQERQIFDDVVRPIQETIAAVFADVAALLARTHWSIETFDALVAQSHARFSFLPTPEEMAFFTRLHHFENFGVFGTSRFDVSERLSFGTRVRNLYRLLRSPRQTLQSGWWPPLTLEQLGLGLLRRPYGTVRFRRTFGKVTP